MDLNNLTISEKLVPSNYFNLALATSKSRENAVKELMTKRKLPNNGLSDDNIEELIRLLSTLDSNNFPNKVGLGEREARIACKLVARRHYNFGHGIGRSGDLLEAQPKAAGSTLLANLTNALLLDLIQTMGVHSCRSCFLVPMATGMTLTLCLLALKKRRPSAKYVLWSRIDQKSCFKSITTAGLTPIIIMARINDDDHSLTTDTDAFELKLNELVSEEILCIYSTTSCFAPRNCDDIILLAEMAKRHNVPHIINNAYGLQSTQLTHQIEQAQRLGRVDLFVQSTDKNLMVPVGGAIIAGFDAALVQSVAKTYAGRACFSQTLDVFMTLLSLGKTGYMQFIKERKQHFEYLRNKLNEFAQQHNAVLISPKRNPISLALSLENLSQSINLAELGSMLYTRGVSGVRVVSIGDVKTIDGYSFQNWGAHYVNFKIPYLTVAASLGITKEEIDIFMKKLWDCWQKFEKNN